MCLQHYMLQSEQLDTVLVLAPTTRWPGVADPAHAPLKGEGNLGGALSHRETKTRSAATRDYNRIAHLASSLTQEELLALDADTILHRLFWEEKLLRFEPLEGWRPTFYLPLQS